MRYRELVQFALLVVGITMLPGAITSSGNYIIQKVFIRAAGGAVGESLPVAIATGIVFAVQWGVILSLVLFSGALSTLLIREDRKLDWTNEVATQLLTIGCAIVGLVLIALAVVHGADAIAESLGRKLFFGNLGKSDPWYLQMKQEILWSLSQMITKLTLGAVLFAGRARVVSTWQAVRGIKPAES